MKNTITFLFLLLCSTELIAQPAGTALTNVALFDGIHDQLITGKTVLVRGRTIEGIIDANEAIPADFEVIDGDGNTLMPGLIDAHTHLNTLEQAQRALMTGTTTVRTAGVSAYQDIGLRELARTGVIAGPDVVAGGVYVTPDITGNILADPRLAPLAGGVNTDEELRLLVRVNIDRGVDVIKTRGTERAGLPQTDPRQQVYTRHQIGVVVDEAARADIPVMVHAHGDEGARAAVLAGARSIEHGSYLSPETLSLMKDRGTFLVPTYITMAEMLEEELDATLRTRGMYMVPRLEAVIREAYSQGVKLATGADNYYDGQSINRVSLEVWHLVRLGVSPFHALQAATVNTAELLMLGELTGKIAEGYEADLILVPGNPLEDVSAIQDVLLVMSNGQVALKRIPFNL
jgi:imidazolonepropionase-like amidohydrolase